LLPAMVESLGLLHQVARDPLQREQHGIDVKGSYHKKNTTFRNYLIAPHRLICMCQLFFCDI
jgi:hypothetical protein